jgi:hypothetical protein
MPLFPRHNLWLAHAVLVSVGGLGLHLVVPLFLVKCCGVQRSACDQGWRLLFRTNGRVAKGRSLELFMVFLMTPSRCARSCA